MRCGQCRLALLFAFHAFVPAGPRFVVRRTLGHCDMKNSTALKQARASVRFLSFAAPIIWGLFVWLRGWQLAAIAGFLSLYLVADLFVIRNVRKGVAKDPEYLKKKIPGT